MRVVHCKKEPYDVYIGRPSKWGNPFRIGQDGTREQVIEMYREWLLGHIATPKGFTRPSLEEAKRELTGKRLGCFCSPLPCHGDILKRFIQTIDPVCLVHGKKQSEHVCLYCCLCFKSLTLDECNVRKDGKKEDVCKPCATREQQEMLRRGLKNG